jgi:hypothetical protein
MSFEFQNGCFKLNRYINSNWIVPLCKHCGLKRSKFLHKKLFQLVLSFFKGSYLRCSQFSNSTVLSFSFTMLCILWFTHSIHDHKGNRNYLLDWLVASMFIIKTGIFCFRIFTDTYRDCALYMPWANCIQPTNELLLIIRLPSTYLGFPSSVLLINGLSPFVQFFRRICVSLFRVYYYKTFKVIITAFVLRIQHYTFFTVARSNVLRNRLSSWVTLIDRM